MKLEGITIQVYRAKMDRYPKASVSAMLDDLQKAGAKRIAWHGFVSEHTNGEGLEQALPALIKLASDHGLGSAAAFGLGDAWDHRPVEAGESIGRTSLITGCEAVILDAEGAWEDEAADKSRAAKLVKALRGVNPTAYVAHQPWWRPTVHWSSFPWEEFEAGVDLDAPQVYFNDYASSHGRDRYAWMCRTPDGGSGSWGEYHKAWKKLTERLAPKGLVRPRIITIQGYGGNDIFADTVDCLLCYPDTIVWSEPFPETYFLRAMRVVKALRERGFTGHTAVHDFEVSAHLKSVEAGHGRAGPEVCRSLGVGVC